MRKLINLSNLKFVYLCWFTKSESYYVVNLVTMLPSGIKIVIKFHPYSGTNFVIPWVDFNSKVVNICKEKWEFFRKLYNFISLWKIKNYFWIIIYNERVF